MRRPPGGRPRHAVILATWTPASTGSGGFCVSTAKAQLLGGPATRTPFVRAGGSDDMVSYTPRPPPGCPRRQRGSSEAVGAGNGELTLTA